MAVPSHGRRREEAVVLGDEPALGGETSIDLGGRPNAVEMWGDWYRTEGGKAVVVDLGWEREFGRGEREEPDGLRDRRFDRGDPLADLDDAPTEVEHVSAGERTATGQDERPGHVAVV